MNIILSRNNPNFCSAESYPTQDSIYLVPTFRIHPKQNFRILTRPQ